MYKLTVIIVVYKPGKEFKKCFDALCRDEFDFNIILFDNFGWNKETASICMAAPKKVRYIANSENVGFGKACNLSVKYTFDDMLLFLNPDILCSKNIIADLCTEQSSNGQNYIISPKLLNIDGNEQSGSRRNHITVKRLIVEYFKLYKIKMFSDPSRRYLIHNIENKNQHIECGSGAIFSICRDRFLKLNGFDERYFLHFEDSDLFLRHSYQEGKVQFLNDISVQHYKSTSNVSSLKIIKHKIISFSKYMLKNNTNIFNFLIVICLIFFVSISLLIRNLFSE